MSVIKYLKHRTNPVKPNKTIEIYKMIKNNNAYKLF
jgi:hypothetical protein